MGEIASRRRNGSEAWDSPHGPPAARLGNLTSLESLSYGEELNAEIPSLTAVLPVTSASIPRLEDQLHTLMTRSDYLSEIVLVPQEALQAECRRSILSILAAADYSTFVELSMTPWLAGLDMDTATFHASKQVTTPFLLVLDEDGLEDIDERGQDALTLLSPFSSAVPIGPRGMASTTGSDPACLSASEVPQPAAFLIPPFVAPTRLFLDSGLDAGRRHTDNTWRMFGQTISNARSDAVGGFVVGSDNAESGWCQQEAPSEVAPHEEFPPVVQVSVPNIQNKIPEVDPTLNDVCPSGFGSFAILLSSEDDLHTFSPAACQLQRSGHTLHVAVYGNFSVSDSPSSLKLEGCSLDYSTLFAEDHVQHATALLSWLRSIPSPADIIITSLSKQSFPGAALSLSTEVPSNKQVIHIPQDDLPYCDWIGALTLEEFRNWHKPQVAVSVITNDRPHSLSRLLDSLSRAHYFGDALDLRVNLEQTADMETQQIVDDFAWNHGRVFLHRRIIHGGLLPAVVESWYPQSNDSYGLILEDDVELSPLFYGWIKLALLRYRYGRPEDTSPQLFGISLYQQKHLELRPEGRHSFNARNTFASIGLSDPSTPYLSQIPCSWGAVYFPEHWREFHAYLSFRLSEYAWDADQIVVPGVRSNKWTRSWKKYFIELAYLRGYVMLYPNYADYVSLSTNHLEVGSHVKDVPIETYMRKKRLFLLPLMPLPESNQSSATGLLELPQGQLPAWAELPTLDLLGLVAREKTLQERGYERRAELTGCEDVASAPYDVWDLLCLHDPLLGLQ
ncbi:uncharacterized protein C8Q71DRAFT_703298 [Rhodofomes roseus]|uniref:Uncharacterized protein n=1 Tax=Rhodofomes roseus TaxID=34475 RepID=A0ABQ8KNV3_9APHY|nr:uncharacterized protein C8Q71DRAFT_703298 [Rhodofomes roseus]KAH9839830.1 hypothetical protein C8Q71DRAFT_703298 [Rhodofomes roseus]